jgi:hypothetical protein
MARGPGARSGVEQSPAWATIQQRRSPGGGVVNTAGSPAAIDPPQLVQLEPGGPAAGPRPCS